MWCALAPETFARHTSRDVLTMVAYTSSWRNLCTAGGGAVTPACAKAGAEYALATQAPAATPSIANFQTFMMVDPPPLKRQFACYYQKASILGNCGQNLLLVVEFLFGRMRVDDAVVDLERHAVKEFAAGAGRTRDTFA